MTTDTGPFRLPWQLLFAEMTCSKDSQIVSRNLASSGAWAEGAYLSRYVRNVVERRLRYLEGELLRCMMTGMLLTNIIYHRYVLLGFCLMCGRRARESELT